MNTKYLILFSDDDFLAHKIKYKHSKFREIYDVILNSYKIAREFCKIHGHLGITIIVKHLDDHFSCNSTCFFIPRTWWIL